MHWKKKLLQSNLDFLYYIVTVNMPDQKKQNIFFRLFKLLIWISFIGGIVFYSKYSTFIHEPLISKNTTLNVQKWETYRTIPFSLKDIEVTNISQLESLYLKVFLKLNPPKNSLQSGQYKVEKNTTIATLYAQLWKPIQLEETNLTFLEWWNIFDIDEYLSNKEYIQKWAFIEYAQNDFIALKWKYPFLESALSLEWFLYPDSYRVFTKKINPEYIAITLLDNFSKKIYTPLMSNLSNAEIYETVNLASIVEKEERNNDEKPTVAGILKKRLDDGWMIGADITVCYPFSLTSEECKLVVTQYINEVNEYNTRTKKGLPKTPIGNPQLSSIEAVLNPAETPFWFYLHNTNTGKIYYARNNAEHEYNKRNYLYKQ